MKESQRLHTTIRDVSPCRDCQERFLACSDKCPKDARGGYGIDAWHNEIKRVKKNKQEYLRLATVRKKVNYYHGGSEDGEE